MQKGWGNPRIGILEEEGEKLNIKEIYCRNKNWKLLIRAGERKGLWNLDTIVGCW